MGWVQNDDFKLLFKFWQTLLHTVISQQFGAPPVKACKSSVAQVKKFQAVLEQTSFKIALCQQNLVVETHWCSEGDRLPGMTVDIFNTRAVVASSAAWIEQNRASIESCIKKIVGISSVIWRRSDSLLALEGFVSTDSSVRCAFQLQNTCSCCLLIQMV